LAKLLRDPNPILRGHAAWALRQIDDRQAKVEIAHALTFEQEGLVIRELAD
jgi:hypothetical protein